MKRSILIIVICVIFLLLLPTEAWAGSGSDYVLRDGHTFYAKYGSSERGDSYALVNYVYAKVTVPGARVFDEVCAVASIYSEGKLVFKSAKVCKSFGPGRNASTKGWYLYHPTASQRVLVRRGQSQVNIEYSYVYNGVLNQFKCEEGMCGAAGVGLGIK